MVFLQFLIKLRIRLFVFSSARDSQLQPAILLVQAQVEMLMMTWMLLMVVLLWSEMVYMGLVLDMVGETHSSLVFLNMVNITSNFTVSAIGLPKSKPILFLRAFAVWIIKSSLNYGFTIKHKTSSYREFVIKSLWWCEKPLYWSSFAKATLRGTSISPIVFQKYCLHLEATI